MQSIRECSIAADKTSILISRKTLASCAVTVLRDAGFKVHYVTLNNILNHDGSFHIAPYVNIDNTSYVVDPLFGGHNGIMNVDTWEKQFRPEKVQFMKGYDETGKPISNIEVINSYGTSGNIKKIEEALK